MTRTVLFAAFEPSGDAHAAAMIAALRTRDPAMRIVALGGPRMKAAGAQLIESTTDKAVMLAGALAQARLHRARVRRVRDWLGTQRIDAFVPVDSPAANWALCKQVRAVQRQAKIVHLVAPQLWAWAPWRIGKLRRLTDHVLCLLPFEPDWFNARGVPATFVGHPLFDPAHAAEPVQVATDVGAPRLALLPGSRQGEIKANWPTMAAVFAQLGRRHEQLVGVVAAASEAAARRIETMGLPPGVRIDRGGADAVLPWADAALVVSGTATLHTARHGVPMAALYNVNRLSWHLVGRWLMTTRTFTLPNLIAEHAGHQRAIVEFVPHFGQVEPVAAAMDLLLTDAAAASEQRAALAAVCAQFGAVRFTSAAADALLAVCAGAAGA